MKNERISDDELAKVSAGLRFIQRELFATGLALIGARRLLGMSDGAVEAEAILALCAKSVQFAAEFVGARAAELAPPPPAEPTGDVS